MMNLKQFTTVYNEMPYNVSIYYSSDIETFYDKRSDGFKAIINIETHFSIRSDFKQFIDVEIRSDALISTQVMGLK